MALCCLSLDLGSSESRKTLEHKNIFQIGTLDPHGINHRFLFNNLFLNRMKEMINFELGKDVEKYVFFRLVACVGRKKSTFLYIFTELKLYHLSNSINIADSSSTQDTCHMNFVIHLAHRRVSVAQW